MRAGNWKTLQQQITTSCRVGCPKTRPPHFCFLPSVCVIHLDFKRATSHSNENTVKNCRQVWRVGQQSWSFQILCKLCVISLSQRFNGVLYQRDSGNNRKSQRIWKIWGHRKKKSPAINCFKLFPFKTSTSGEEAHYSTPPGCLYIKICRIETLSLQLECQQTGKTQKVA